jgi:hypothetical protein
MAITRDDLRNYTKMKLDLDSIDLQIESAYDTYKSPALSASGSSHSSDPGDPVTRALSRIESLKANRQKIVDRMIEIETFVECIEDWYERAICRLRYIEGYTWDATCYRLRKHHSSSAIIAYDREWWKCRGDSESPQ